METLYYFNPTLYSQLNEAIDTNDVCGMKKVLRRLLDIRCDENRDVLVPIIRSVDDYIYERSLNDTDEVLENDRDRFSRIMNNNNDQQLPRHIQQYC